MSALPKVAGIPLSLLRPRKKLKSNEESALKAPSIEEQGGQAGLSLSSAVVPLASPQRSSSMGLERSSSLLQGSRSIKRRGQALGGRIDLSETRVGALSLSVLTPTPSVPVEVFFRTLSRFSSSGSEQDSNSQLPRFPKTLLGPKSNLVDAWASEVGRSGVGNRSYSLRQRPISAPIPTPPTLPSPLGNSLYWGGATAASKPKVGAREARELEVNGGFMAQQRLSFRATLGSAGNAGEVRLVSRGLPDALLNNSAALHDHERRAMVYSSPCTSMKLPLLARDFSPTALLTEYMEGTLRNHGHRLGVRVGFGGLKVRSLGKLGQPLPGEVITYAPPTGLVLHRCLDELHSLATARCTHQNATLDNATTAQHLGLIAALWGSSPRGPRDTWSVTKSCASNDVDTLIGILSDPYFSAFSLTRGEVLGAAKELIVMERYVRWLKDAANTALPCPHTSNEPVSGIVLALLKAQWARATELASSVDPRLAFFCSAGGTEPYQKEWLKKHCTQVLERENPPSPFLPAYAILADNLSHPSLRPYLSQQSWLVSLLACHSHAYDTHAPLQESLDHYIDLANRGSSPFPLANPSGGRPAQRAMEPSAIASATGLKPPPNAPPLSSLFYLLKLGGKGGGLGGDVGVDVEVLTLLLNPPNVSSPPLGAPSYLLPFFLLSTLSALSSHHHRTSLQAEDENAEKNCLERVESALKLIPENVRATASENALRLTNDSNLVKLLVTLLKPAPLAHNTAFPAQLIGTPCASFVEPPTHAAVVEGLAWELESTGEWAMAVRTFLSAVGLVLAPCLQQNLREGSEVTIKMSDPASVLASRYLEAARMCIVRHTPPPDTLMTEARHNCPDFLGENATLFWSLAAAKPSATLQSLPPFQNPAQDTLPPQRLGFLTQIHGLMMNWGVPRVWPAAGMALCALGSSSTSLPLALPLLLSLLSSHPAEFEALNFGGKGDSERLWMAQALGSLLSYSLAPRLLLQLRAKKWIASLLTTATERHAASPPETLIPVFAGLCGGASFLNTDTNRSFAFDEGGCFGVECFWEGGLDSVGHALGLVMTVLKGSPRHSVLINRCALLKKCCSASRHSHRNQHYHNDAEQLTLDGSEIMVLQEWLRESTRIVKDIQASDTDARRQRARGSLDSPLSPQRPVSLLPRVVIGTQNIFCQRGLPIAAGTPANPAALVSLLTDLIARGLSPI